MKHTTISAASAGWWLALAGGVAAVVGCSQAPVTAPTSYAQYNADDGTFACDYPQGWEASGGGKHGPIWATFRSGPAEIRINGDVAGSLAGDILGSFSAGAGVEAPAHTEPVQEVHMLAAEDAKNQFSSYVETGQPAVLDVSLGPARRSEFTASTTFGSKLHGYRATVLGHDKRIEVYCVSPESDWQTLEPAFTHVLSTLKRGATR